MEETHIMLKPKFPYRFKTQKEFIEAYGDDWRDTYIWFAYEMDYLFGTELEQNVTTNFESSYSNIDIPRRGDSNDYWTICIEHLTKNELKPPSYNPKKFVY